MKSINRTAIVVAAKQAFVDWINDVAPDKDEPLTVLSANSELTVYLIPHPEEASFSINHLAPKFRTSIWREEVGGWVTDLSKWPTGVSVELFNAWFDCQFASVVFDLHSHKSGRKN